ncbi:formylglycine-generating enzyme family protein [Pedosphaera parvula]|uniref:Sulfatase-modifying factor enzyme-like domain-containing protein n=1 Tax=Pedosphaera parvula (strain Ellin514) TaxID=320771 RepID=B9XBW7_PEDPL|nr:SUMF1/EgtB/PvdO family nonheme iron enzyme [Pedosphaera parvula]EEF62435.1 protein of unknown function DUF323 [Pedosphaera parvula Ellin514]
MRFKVAAICGLIVLSGWVARSADGQQQVKTNQLKLSKVVTNNTVLVKTNLAIGAVTIPVPVLVTNATPQMPGDPYTNSVGMEFVKLGGGSWAGRYEVTQREYQLVMGSAPSHFSGARLPVDSVTYDDAVEFCQKLTEQELKEKKLPEGFSYTLPTEGQWEGLVADASLAQAVTSANGSRSSTSPVGSLAPNSLGLYDVRGNVMEFCLGSAMPYRVLRGGSWQDWISVNLRLDFRYYARPDERKDTFGFRCLLVQSGKK